MASQHSCFIQLVTHRRIGPSLLQVQVCPLKADKGRKCSRLVYFPTKILPPPNPRGEGVLSQRVAPHTLWPHTTLGPSPVNWWPTHTRGFTHVVIQNNSWPPTNCANGVETSEVCGDISFVHPLGVWGHQVCGASNCLTRDPTQIVHPHNSWLHSTRGASEFVASCSLWPQTPRDLTHSY